MLHSLCESLFTVQLQFISCACDLMILLLVVDMDCDLSSFLYVSLFTICIKSNQCFALLRLLVSSFPCCLVKTSSFL
jgi:hypothetical protein